MKSAKEVSGSSLRSRQVETTPSGGRAPSRGCQGGAEKSERPPHNHLKLFISRRCYGAGTPRCRRGSSHGPQAFTLDSLRRRPHSAQAVRRTSRARACPSRHRGYGLISRRATPRSSLVARRSSSRRERSRHVDQALQLRGVRPFRALGKCSPRERTRLCGASRGNQRVDAEHTCLETEASPRVSRVVPFQGAETRGGVPCAEMSARFVEQVKLFAQARRGALRRGRFRSTSGSGVCRRDLGRHRAASGAGGRARRGRTRRGRARGGRARRRRRSCECQRGHIRWVYRLGVGRTKLWAMRFRASGRVACRILASSPIRTSSALSPGHLCYRCGAFVPEFPDSEAQRCALKAANGQQPSIAAAELVVATGCSGADAELWTRQAGRARSSVPGPPCPFCHHALPTSRSQQCLHCKADWHEVSSDGAY